MKSSAQLKFFTLIELLIVISIIGVIISISFVSFSNIRQKGRDTKRIADIKLIQKSLGDYYRDEGLYPDTLTPGESLTGSSSNAIYMQTIPQNPSPKNDGVCPNREYTYEITATSTSYKIDFCLSEPTAQLSAGEKCATPQGILNRVCFLCGDTTSYGGETYPTVLIGNQCWMAKNLNIGTKVNGSENQGNYSDGIQKYCYDDDDSLCAIYGGLYQWHMAAGKDQSCDYFNCDNDPSNICCLVTGNAICPSGWHLPSDAEITVLETYLGGASIAGGKMKETGTTHWNSPNTGADNSSGFTALPSGARYYATLSFIQINDYGYIWSSSVVPGVPLNSWTRYLSVSDSESSAYGGGHNRDNGFPVRCLKD